MTMRPSMIPALIVVALTQFGLRSDVASARSKDTGKTAITIDQVLQKLKDGTYGGGREGETAKRYELHAMVLPMNASMARSKTEELTYFGAEKGDRLVLLEIKNRKTLSQHKAALNRGFIRYLERAHGVGEEFFLKAREDEHFNELLEFLTKEIDFKEIRKVSKSELQFLLRLLAIYEPDAIKTLADPIPDSAEKTAVLTHAILAAIEMDQLTWDSDTADKVLKLFPSGAIRKEAYRKFATQGSLQIAIAFVRGLPEGEVKATLLGRIAQSNPELVASNLGLFPKGPIRDLALLTLASDGWYAFQHFNDFPPGPIRDRALQAIAGGLSSSKEKLNEMPEERRTAFLDFYPPGEVRELLLNSLALIPELAILEFERFPAGPIRDRAIKTIQSNSLRLLSDRFTEERKTEILEKMGILSAGDLQDFVINPDEDLLLGSVVPFPGTPECQIFLDRIESYSHSCRSPEVKILINAGTFAQIRPELDVASASRITAEIESSQHSLHPYAHEYSMSKSCEFLQKYLSDRYAKKVVLIPGVDIPADQVLDALRDSSELAKISPFPLASLVKPRVEQKLKTSMEVFERFQNACWAR